VYNLSVLSLQNQLNILIQNFLLQFYVLSSIAEGKSVTQEKCGHLKKNLTGNRDAFLIRVSTTCNTFTHCKNDD